MDILDLFEIDLWNKNIPVRSLNGYVAEIANFGLKRKILGQEVHYILYLLLLFDSLLEIPGAVVDCVH